MGVVYVPNVSDGHLVAQLLFAEQMPRPVNETTTRKYYNRYTCARAHTRTTAITRVNW